MLGVKDERAKRLLRSLTGWDFAEPLHSWLWGELRRGGLTVESARVCRTKFRRFLVAIVSKCLEQSYWWHCDYYLEVVAEAAAKRNIE